MKGLIAVLSVLFLARAFAADDAPTHSAMASDLNANMHRYLVERTFPLHALEGLDATTKAKVNANNASVGVRWVSSYANADETKTYCVYEGPSEAAIRKAAAPRSSRNSMASPTPSAPLPRAATAEGSGPYSWPVSVGRCSSLARSRTESRARQ